MTKKYFLYLKEKGRDKRGVCAWEGIILYWVHIYGASAVNVYGTGAVK